MRYLLTVLLISLSACASNPYKKFYTDNTGGKDITSLPVIIPDEQPRLLSGSDPQEDSKKMLENGYVLIGYSSFNGPSSNPDDAVKFGKSLHAEAVLFYSKFANTVSGSMPITSPTQQTSFTTANASAYGSNGGYAHATGYGTTTTYGTQTNYIPFSVDRYEQGAQYWIRTKPKVFGAIVKNLSDEKKKQVGSNKGVEVVIVVNASPAFNADIMVGDIIKKIEDKEISDVPAFMSTVPEFAEKTVLVEIYRDGKKIIKTITLNKRSS